MCNEKDKHIYTNYTVTGWMLFLITHIREDVFKNTNRNHIKQVNTDIKTLFSGVSDKELHETLDIFWSDYENSVIIIILLTVMYLSGVLNIFVMVILICGIRNTLYHQPKPFVF